MMKEREKLHFGKIGGIILQCVIETRPGVVCNQPRRKRDENAPGLACHRLHLIALFSLLGVG
jgi:hypothetical protein